MKKLLSNKNIIFTLVILILIITLFFVPTGFEVVSHSNTTRAQVKVLEVDSSMIRTYGLISEGSQLCKVKILNGRFKGIETEGINQLIGKLEMDKVFSVGDRALVAIDYNEEGIVFTTMVDHYRINLEIILFLGFMIILILFSGWMGVRAIFSFVLTILTIWKVLIPLFLKGYNPIILSLLVVIFLTTVIIILVSGFNRKSWVAILGSVAGSLLTCILAVIFGTSFKVHGAVLHFSESLLYSGFANLKLTDIFIASIFLASAGALMDLAMDISAAVYEIVEKKPDISRKEAIKSGFSIGRSVLGTMTTTLLLAYSGGYVALLMVFMAQGTPLINIMNLKYVSGEILNTIVGSFGLVTVAPFTAILAGIFFTKDKSQTSSNI